MKCRIVRIDEPLEDRVLLAAGTFDSGEFNFCVSVRFDATPAQIQKIKDGFQAASQILADATDGQHRFGTVTIVNNSGASQTAEYWVHSGAGRANAVANGYGVRGRHVNLYFGSDFDGTDGSAYTIAHEHAHQAYGILDQYSGPKDDGSLPANHPDKVENAPYPDTATLNYSLMDNFFIRGGRATGGAYTLNEFSVPSNHDPDNDTWQSVINGKSDWEQIAASRFPAVPPVGLPVDAPPPAHTVTFKDGSSGLAAMMVIDRSGSMSTDDRLVFAKSGAVTFANSFDPGDDLGVASFDDGPAVNFALTEIVDAGTIAAANAAINAISLGGATNIGGGLQTALDEIIAQVERSCNEIIVLLSDGDHNSGTHPDQVIPLLQKEGVTVFTVGVGTGISTSGQATLQNIAAKTGGLYVPVASASGIVALLNIIAQQSQGAGLLVQAPVRLAQGGTNQTSVPVEGGATSATFSIAIADSSDDITMSLRSPSGAVISEATAQTNPSVKFTSGPNSKSFEILSPEAGNWTVDLTGTTVNTGSVDVQAFSESPDYDFSVSVRENVLTFPTSLVIEATPNYMGRRVTGAAVTATVTGPAGIGIPVTLHDDGLAAHGDSFANDGIYTAIFTQFAGSGDGSYTVSAKVVNTSGETYAGEELYSAQPANILAVPSFTRISNTSAVVTNVPSAAGAVTGRKWNDDNANGVHDAGEAWLNGWTIELYDNAGALVSTTITADFDVDGNGTIDPATETGWYRFNNLADGDYRVDETARPGWQQSYPIHPVAALAHQLDVSANFRTTANNFQGWAGLKERWLQSNSGWHYVTPAGGLFKWISGRGDTLRSELVAKLDPTYYNDLNLLAAPTAPQGHRITITAGSQVTDIDFGNYGASTIQGQKWEDSNTDGVRAGSERLLNGWEIQLIDAVSGSIVQSTMTRNVDLNLDGLIDPQTEVGVYQFTGLIPGKYEVREVPKAGWLQSTPTQALRQLAYNIDTSRAFQTSNGNFLNWGNLSEKWLLGNDGWYFITPDGVLSKWNQSPSTSLTGTKVAELSPWFYAQTDRLTNAVDPLSSLIDTSTEVHVTGADFGNYRANGASGLRVTGRSSPTLTPGNVTVTISRGDIRVTGDRWHNQVGLFVDWKGNLVAVGLQGTTVNGKSAPVILQADSSAISGSIFADMNAGDDLIALQGFGAGKNVRVDGGNGADSVFMLDMQIGGNVDVLSGWGAGTIAISNSAIAKNLTIYGSEAEDDVVLDRVTVSNRTNIQMGASGDRLISSRSIFHDSATMSLGAGNDMMLAVAKNDFKRLLSVNGNAGRDSASTSTVVASRKAFAGIEATDVPNVSAVLDDVLAELATLGLEETLLP